MIHKIYSKLKIFISFLKQQAKIDPLRLGIALFLLFLSIGGAAYTYGTHLSTSNEAQKILSLPKGTLSSINNNLASGLIDKIVSHTLNDGTFLVPSTKKVYEITYKSGNKELIISALMNNETVSKYFYESVLKQDIKIEEGLDHSIKNNRIADFLFFLLYIGALVFLILIFYRAGQDLLVGKSFSTTTQNLDISFNDIVGYEEVKEEFFDVIERLNNPQMFSKIGISAAKGILLTGNPGVGKTLFAKALANESKANFLYATGADFAELYVGVGARRIRALFKQARTQTPCVIFIDEIDALGSRSGHGMDSERLATINQILAEMDGMNENYKILVIGATNHTEKLDPALLRPGRFDKTIHIPNPDTETRQKLFNFYLKDVLLDSDIDLLFLSHRSIGFSGAQVKNVIQEAKTQSMRRKSNFKNDQLILTKKDFDNAFDTLLLGYGIKNIPENELKRIAIHELGHALITHEKAPNMDFQKISIEGRGSALGFTLQYPNFEQNLFTEKELLIQIQMLLAGRAAESIFFDSISNGSKDDLQKATQIALHMVCEIGFGKRTQLLSLVNQNQKLNSNAEEDIKEILDSQFKEACRSIQNKKQWIEQKSSILLELKTLSKNQLFGDF